VTCDPTKTVVLVSGQAQSVNFTYSTTWFSTDIPYSRREEYIDVFFPRQGTENRVHWLSIFNSFTLVILLIGVVTTILMRVLGNDYQRYDPENLGQKPEDDYGWKLIHTDVFRFPQRINLLSSMIGVGVQFLCLVAAVLLLSGFGIYYPGNDGALLVSGVVCYALTAIIGGFMGAYWYRLFEGTEWARNIILTACLFAIPFFVITGILNTVGLSQGITKALPFGTIMSVLALWAFLGLPLTLFGGIAGRRMSGPFVPPSKVKNAARELPNIPFYASLPVKMLAGGFLAFSAIYIEVHYIFESIWGRSHFQLWGVLALVFVLLIIVTGFASATLTYVQLSMEDYLWWWPSFMWGGATGFWIFGYGVYFWLYRSSMSGQLQATYFFGYQLLICYFFFLMLGSVGFLCAFAFVKRIYRNLHTD